MWVLLRLPRFGGARHANDHDGLDRTVKLPSARRGCRRPCGHSPSAQRRHVVAFFQKLPPCLVGIEACASSHHWSREPQALGHTVKLMPPSYVKPYVKRHKNDVTDEEGSQRQDDYGQAVVKERGADPGSCRLYDRNGGRPTGHRRQGYARDCQPRHAVARGVNRSGSESSVIGKRRDRVHSPQGPLQYLSAAL